MLRVEQIQVGAGVIDQPAAVGIQVTCVKILVIGVALLALNVLTQPGSDQTARAAAPDSSARSSKICIGWALPGKNRCAASRSISPITRRRWQDWKQRGSSIPASARAKRSRRKSRAPGSRLPQRIARVRA